MNITLTQPFRRADLKLGIMFNYTGHFVRLESLDTWREKIHTMAATSPLPDVPIRASHIETSHASNI
jgi:hypothetical protein